MSLSALVNEFWHFCGNERSLRFMKHSIQNFPIFCLLGPDGNPEPWTLMDQTESCEWSCHACVPRTLSCIFYFPISSTIRSRLWINWVFPCMPTWTKTSQLYKRSAKAWNKWPCPVDDTCGSECPWKFLQEKKWFQIKMWGEFHGGPVVRTWRFHCCGLGSIPCQGTKILQAARRGQKKNKRPGTVV